MENADPTPAAGAQFSKPAEPSTTVPQWREMPTTRPRNAVNVSDTPRSPTEAIIPTEVHVKMTVSGPISQEENDELVALSLDRLDEKREAARLQNWLYQPDIAKSYNRKVRTTTFQEGD